MNRVQDQNRLLDMPILFDRRAAFARVSAEAIQPGQGWLFGHEPGSPAIAGYSVGVDNGTLAFHVPLPSELLYDASISHLKQANRLRQQVLKTAISPNDRYPQHKDVRNYDLIFKFFQEAMAGISLVYAALNSFANEHIPRNFEIEIQGQTLKREHLIHKGIVLRLSKVLAKATGEPYLMEKGEMWSRIIELKELRDGIEHADGGVEAFKFGCEVDETIFAKLLNVADFESFAKLVRNVIDMYRTGEEGPTAIETPQGGYVTVMSARRFLEHENG